MVRLEALEAQRPHVRAALAAAGLPRIFAEATAGPYGATHGTLELLEGVEEGIVSGLAAAEALRARVAADRRAGFAAGALTADEESFAAALAVRVACGEALDATLTDRLPGGPLPDKPFADVTALLAAGDALAAPLARDLAGYVEHYRRHPDPARRLGDDGKLAACVRSHLRRLELAAIAACDEPRHAALRDALAGAPLALPGVRYAGAGAGGPLERRGAAAPDEEPDLVDIELDDIVGNAEVVAAATKLARAVAAFDLAAGRNPRKIDNPVLFILGSPGCGKTMTAHAVGRYFLGLCREAGIPGRFRVIRKTDWASHYQNKSASDLLRIFRDEVFDFPGVCGAYWPDIDTAFAARGDPDVRAEEKANLATLFGILDGTVGPKNGKWFLLCDANYMQMDDAMVSRLTQDPKVARGPETPADYVRLLRDIKLRGWRELLPADEAWGAVGERLASSKLSGRAVAAVAGRVLAELQDVPEPPGFLSLGFDEKVAALRAAARPVSAGRILEHVEHYQVFEKEAAERAARDRFERRVEEIRLQLSASAAALRP
jgi:hypothetical protein